MGRPLIYLDANIVINGFGDKAAIEKERAGIEKDFSVKATYSPADMTKPAEIAEMIRTAEATFGSVDILVNNAGIQHVAPIEEFPIDKWDAIIAINLSALPLLPGAQPLARRPYLTRASATNSSFVAAGLRIEGQPDPNRLEFFYDPQTSGGLLICIQADKADALVADAKNRGAQATCVIGEVLNRTDAALILRE